MRVMVALFVALLFVIIWRILGGAPRCNCAAGDVCIDGNCVPGCGGKPPCALPAMCVAGQCVAPPSCGQVGPPCVPPAACVGQRCVLPPRPCAGGPPCAPPDSCIGGLGCGRLQGNCYGWVPLDLNQPAVPANAVGAVQTSSTSLNMPAIAFDGSLWYAGAAYLPWPLPANWSASNWLDSFQGFLTNQDAANGSPPAQMWYLAANAACSRQPSRAADATSAVAAASVPVCWGPTGALVPMWPEVGACPAGTFLVSQ